MHMMKGHCNTSFTDLFQFFNQCGETREERELWAKAKKVLGEAGILSDMEHSMRLRNVRMFYFVTEQI